MRSQLTSLKALIDAILTLTAAQVDGTTTLNPGDPATAAVSVDGNTLRFTFGIPQGLQGEQGIQGFEGGPGPQGPPFATAIVDGVATLDPGMSATVSVSFDGTNVHFTFGIPRGEAGGTGDQGIQGPPGEVTASQLNTAIATSALNPSGVSPLNIGFSEPPTASELTEVKDKLNELLTALQRMP